LPIFLCYGIIFEAPVGFYFSLPLIFLPFVFLAGSLGILITLLLTAFLPVRRTRDLLVILSVLMVTLLFMVFRLMRPEQLVNPISFPLSLNIWGPDRPGVTLSSEFLGQRGLLGFSEREFLPGPVPLLVLWSSAWLFFLLF